MSGQETETVQQLGLKDGTEKPKDDTNSFSLVNGESSIVKKDTDENTIQPDPDTTSSPTMAEGQTVPVQGSAGGPGVQPCGVEDKPQDDTNSLNNTAKKDSDKSIIKSEPPTNTETKDDIGELTASADVKSEDLAEEQTSDVTQDTVNTEQVDGFTGGPDVHAHQDEDVTNEAAGDHEGGPENDPPEPELLDTSCTEEETNTCGMPVETIGSGLLESVEHTATDATGILRGNWWILMAVAVVVLAAILAVHLTPSSPSESPPENRVDVFIRQMEKVKAQFLNQRAEVWKRSRIHLQRHLQTAQPTAPVSLILTAGLRAEKTLHCLAQGLASSLSSALKASVLHINGTTAARQDSDQVKLDIDRKLQSAFEGDKPVAIIHRLEELPPGSTLIFYRYCDHENAAYKEKYLIFTVLLEEEEEIPAKMHLNAVEEMVDDHLKNKFLSHDHPVSFDRMDIDKYGGLWSRISHLILPVAAEDRIEREGCPGWKRINEIQ